MIRATKTEKDYAVESCKSFKERNKKDASVALSTLKTTALQTQNIFDSLMEATKVCTLGQLSNALYQVGGQYRRNM